jgi:hypothetical protein
MNAKQIREVLNLCRPALVGMYGSQGLQLVAYSELRIAMSLYSGRFQIYGEQQEENYLVRLLNNEVVALRKGEIEE